MAIFSDVAIKAFLPMMQNVKQTVDAIFQLFEQGHSALGDKNFWRNLIDPALVDWLDENVIHSKTLPQIYHEEYPEHSPMGRAVGGAVGSGTPYVVGERGPELFVPSSSGIIIPDLGTGSYR